MAVRTGVFLLVVALAVVGGAFSWKRQEYGRHVPTDLLVGIAIIAAAGVVFIAIGNH